MVSFNKSQELSRNTIYSKEATVYHLHESRMYWLVKLKATQNNGKFSNYNPVLMHALKSHCREVQYNFLPYQRL
jgi:hypothetical protein